jgi:ribosomal protein L19
METNKVLDSPIIQNEGLTAYTPRYMVIKKGVIRDISENLELENSTQQLNSDNQNKHLIPFQVTDAVRLKMRVKEKNEGRKMGVERVEGSMFDIQN